MREKLRAYRKALVASLLIVLAGLLVLIFLGGYLFGWLWTGFGTTKSPLAPQAAKTLWDRLQLLIIAAALSAGGLWFNVQQNERQQLLSVEQHKKDQELAEERRRAETDLAEKHRLADIELALDQQRENALQTYLDRMAELLLQGKLRESEEGAEIRQVA